MQLLSVMWRHNIVIQSARCAFYRTKLVLGVCANTSMLPFFCL